MFHQVSIAGIMGLINTLDELMDKPLPEPTVLESLRRISSLIETTRTSLRAQRDLLESHDLPARALINAAIAPLPVELNILENAVVNEQIELAQLRTLANNAAMINSSLDPDTVLNQAMDAVISLTGAERGCIILKNSRTGELEYRVMRETDLSHRPSNPQISLTIVNEVMETGKPLLTDNAYKDDRFRSGESIIQMALRSVLCVPLTYRNRITGVVYVDNRLRAGIFDQREKNLLVAFANQAAIAIENARLYNRIQSSLVEIGEMQQLMENVFDSIASGIITIDARHSVTTFNRAAARILGVRPEQIIGQRVGEVLTGIVPQIDLHLARVRARDTDQFVDVETEIVGRGRVALNVKFSPLKDERNNTRGVVMVLDDLTEERSREAMLAAIRRYLPLEMIDNIHHISRLALGGERREVTCMFINVCMPETFSPGARPQQIMEQINVYLARATDCIHRYKGVIDKYMGTDIMVLFNTPLNPQTDHAVRAVKTALALRTAFIALYNELGIQPDPHYYRIGIHTGEATLGNVGSLSRREFTAIGDTINLARRIEENTQGGQILITQTTYGALQPHLRKLDATVGACSPLQVKGRQQLTQVYEVIPAHV